MTINHKSLSDATSESAHGIPSLWAHPPWGSLSLAVAVPARAAHKGAGPGPVVALLCWVSPGPEQNVTLNTNCVGAAVLTAAPAAPGSRGNELGFLAIFLLCFPPHTLFSLFSIDCPS